MRFAVSKEIITPIKNMKLACSSVFDNEFSQIHDDVYVRCLVIDDNKNKIVLMSMDLLFHDRLLNNTIAEYAARKYNIPESSFVLAYTHSHTAPATRGYNLNHHDEQYEELLVERAKSCLDRAMCSMFEGSMEYGFFDADFNVSRRGNIDGKYDMYPDFNYPRDRRFWVMCIRDKENTIRSIVSAYACHPVFYPTTDSISGEFPARLCQLLDTEYYGCTSMFFQTAGADVRPMPTVDMENFNEEAGIKPWLRNFNFSHVDSFAKGMRDSIVNFINGDNCKKINLDIASDSFKIDLPIDGKPLKYFQNCKDELIDTPDNPNRCHAIYIADGGYNNLADSLELNCSVLKLSQDFYIATMGGEPSFGAKSAAIEPFAGKDVCFIGYTDACAYIVDDRMLAEGGYEPTCHLEYCLKGPFKPGLNAKYTEAFENSFKRINS